MTSTIATRAQRSTAVPPGFSPGPSGAPATWLAGGAGAAARASSSAAVGRGSAKSTPGCGKVLTSGPWSISLGAILRALKLAPLLLAAVACSPRRYALRQVAVALSSGGEGGAFARDDDPELVRDAVPFALKTMESLAEELPDDVPLRLGLARGFTEYAYAFVQQPAELGAPPDVAAAEMARARKLYLRARAYGLDGLRLARGVTADELRKSPGAAVAKFEKGDVPLVYWTLAAWAAAISADKRDMALVGDVPVVAAMLDRALQLDESFDEGTLHEFAITFDSARPEGRPVPAKAHLERALQLAQGEKISALVSYAQAVSGPEQNKPEYESLLKQAAAFDVEQPKARNDRLANVLAKRRAQYLLAHEDDVFSD